MGQARCPALLLAAPASGQGKTTITAALARLLTRRGQRVRVFKCGPDFLDPHWHALASEGPVYQLDLWINGEADCRQRLHAAAQEADVILIEGVMGLFDGEPSAADLAQRLGVPVLAVIDASAMAGTFGALAYGLRHYRANLPWAGVLANRVGSARHAEMLQAGLRDPRDWMGAVMRVAMQSATAVPEAKAAAALLPERHLGLVAAHELPDALQRLDAAADALAATPLGQLTPEQWERFAVDFPAQDLPPTPRLLEGRTVAIARDAAFCFLYAANLDTLQAMGARLAFFSPLAGDRLPVCDALWLPGGYPELHGARLRANAALRADMDAHMAAGKPVWAECGGMMALMESVTRADGQTEALWGLLPGQVTMQRRLAALGPQQLDWQGQVLRGHTFHYSTTVSPLSVVARTARPGQPAQAEAGEALYRHGSVHASYFHPWFASNPGLVARWMGGEVA